MNDLIFDMHVHTKYSCDSSSEMDALCAEAVRKGVRSMCLTDHVDCNCHDDGYGYYDAEGFFRDFSAAREKYTGKLELLCGIEFAEPHLYPERLAEHTRRPYDYVLGAIHFWYQNMFASQLVETGVPVEVCYEHYWNEMLAAVRAGGFDCVAHTDFPKRYYGELRFGAEILREICSEMVRRGICLEINTSTLRKGFSETMPDKAILEVYKACGGRYVTVGSDAHHTGDVAAGWEYAAGLIGGFGFEEVVFRRRAMCRAADV
ncbi:MAG: histidinol-phosphatase HisJ family protein [Oscillospiraceae bacterium]|nr:histidinol-phosphatase HisJ family protein [Oscillospiraceae bacterium]